MNIVRTDDFSALFNRLLGMCAIEFQYKKFFLSFFKIFSLIKLLLHLLRFV